jgi:Flp pilus assembly secretin CpaC
MRNARTVGLGLVALVGFGVLAWGRMPEPARALPQYQFNLVITEYNEAGDSKVIAEPRLTTLGGRPASFLSGGEIPVTLGQGQDAKLELIEFGISVTMMARPLEEGKVRLDLTFRDSRPEKSTGDSVRVRSRSVQSIEPLPLGQTAKLELQKAAPDGGRWKLEVRVHEAK